MNVLTTGFHFDPCKVFRVENPKIKKQYMRERESIIEEIEDEGQVLRVSGQLEMSVHVFAVNALNSSIENESWTFNQAFIDFFVSKVISLHVSNLLFFTFNWIFQPIISLLFSISLEGFTIFYLCVILSTIIFLEDES